MNKQKYFLAEKVSIKAKLKDNTILSGVGDIEVLLKDIWITNVQWNPPKPTKVIFNPPATIVFWEDGSKTVVKVQDEKTKRECVIRGGRCVDDITPIIATIPINEYGRETFDKEKGLALAFCKKIMGNKGNYYNMFKKWCE